MNNKTRTPLQNCIKMSPHEIGTYASWFNRYLNGGANPKWVDQHLEQLLSLLQESTDIPPINTGEDGNEDLDIFLEKINNGDAVSASDVFNKWAMWNQTLNKRISSLEQNLGDILAVIHCDGGHYITEHGWNKAIKDAHEEWAKLKTESHQSENEQLKKELEHLKGVIQAQAIIASSIVQVAERNDISVPI